MSGFTIKQEEGQNRKCIQQTDGIKVFEYLKDLSVGPLTAFLAYYASEMNLRKRQVWIDLSKGSFRLQGGSMQMMVGNVDVKTDIKSAGDFVGKLVKSVVTNETIVKPLYSGSGIVILEPTYKHILLMNPSEWQDGLVVEDGMYLASSDSVDIQIQARKNISSALLGGEGLFNTKLSGNGMVILESSVPAEELMEVILDDDCLKVDGSYAVAWSGSLSFTVERTTKTLIGSAASGEGLVNVYRGSGKILLAPIDAEGEEKAIKNTKSIKANPTMSKAANAFSKLTDFLD